ncbi:MAG: Ribosome-binding factor A [Candidatus Moranbacteria bacterium GW2011_GWE2_35_2-]|nr:MAG: Ribosome-binding factor A [Candidatus Moranbacteria bacterium GW2011_GWE2_35_2-]KKQ05148.1 MAG: Ribosome-binding factor A [Candidatus Moranbacteria bacterium GW2011_GWF1_36_4]KKQ22385.1 MAG: Ribosome-binding factor A [Candidatus Moranbacteria bacterium GW2011_GWF2_37_11]KKQ29453.1 MAG: Ribosome-binding factor A [Candidatus Moranbacteria bacterium GW2011_GWD1_37_17]KKQ30679.1 MAG: Ribosome-binding factor A [Candidatus Moranbacteria bacterium GW2011_GWE1_37_24]KKQ47118.1 MAG: Ribosome-bi
MSLRVEKINSLISKHISEIISRQLSLKPGVLVTVSKVDTSSDLRYSQVSVSIFPEKETAYVINTLKKEIYAIQGSLNRKMPTRIIPKIRFKPDATKAEADAIEKILKKI